MNGPDENQTLSRTERAREAFDRFVRYRDAGEEISTSEWLGKHVDIKDLLEPLMSSLKESQTAGAGEKDEDSFYPGRVIGDYRLIRELGRGGMGIVFLAEQISLPRRIALKLLPANFSVRTKVVDRFRREGEAVAKLNHPNIVRIHGVGAAEHCHFFAMEYVDGKSLRQILTELRGLPVQELEATSVVRSAGGPPEEWLAGVHSDEEFGIAPEIHVGANFLAGICRLVARIADALHYAHEAGVIHRDIKPSNILINRSGTPIIVDFGLALVEDMSPLTMTGELTGTPYYMSPEQAMARRLRVDLRTDIYSLGVTLYELVTLRVPFGGETRQEVFSKIITAAPVLPSKLNSIVGHGLEKTILKCLEKEPSKRYSSCEEMAAALREVSTQPKLLTRRPPSRLVMRLRKVGLVAAAAIILISLIFGAGYVINLTGLFSTDLPGLADGTAAGSPGATDSRDETTKLPAQVQSAYESIQNNLAELVDDVGDEPSGERNADRILQAVEGYITIKTVSSPGMMAAIAEKSASGDLLRSALKNSLARVIAREMSTKTERTSEENISVRLKAAEEAISILDDLPGLEAVAPDVFSKLRTRTEIISKWCEELVTHLPEMIRKAMGFDKDKLDIFETLAENIDGLNSALVEMPGADDMDSQLLSRDCRAAKRFSRFLESWIPTGILYSRASLVTGARVKASAARVLDLCSPLVPELLKDSIDLEQCLKEAMPVFAPEKYGGLLEKISDETDKNSYDRIECTNLYQWLVEFAQEIEREPAIRYHMSGPEKRIFEPLDFAGLESCGFTPRQEEGLKALLGCFEGSYWWYCNPDQIDKDSDPGEIGHLLELHKPWKEDLVAISGRVDLYLLDQLGKMFNSWSSSPEKSSPVVFNSLFVDWEGKRDNIKERLNRWKELNLPTFEKTNQLLVYIESVMEWQKKCLEIIMPVIRGEIGITGPEFLFIVLHDPDSTILPDPPRFPEPPGDLKKLMRGPVPWSPIGFQHTHVFNDKSEFASGIAIWLLNSVEDEIQAAWEDMDGSRLSFLYPLASLGDADVPASSIQSILAEIREKHGKRLDELEPLLPALEEKIRKVADDSIVYPGPGTRKGWNVADSLLEWIGFMDVMSRLSHEECEKIPVRFRFYSGRSDNETTTGDITPEKASRSYRSVIIGEEKKVWSLTGRPAELFWRPGDQIKIEGCGEGLDSSYSGLWALLRLLDSGIPVKQGKNGSKRAYEFYSKGASLVVEVPGWLHLQVPEFVKPEDKKKKND